MSWLVDMRAASTSEKVSLDLCRHLPRRLTVGPIAVICERPLIFLSVIRKRWMNVVREVERQYSCTLDQCKKQALQAELARLRTAHFVAWPSTKASTANAVFLCPSDIEACGNFSTVYIATPLVTVQITQILRHLERNGLVVAYHGEPEMYFQPVL